MMAALETFDSSIDMGATAESLGAKLLPGLVIPRQGDSSRRVSYFSAPVT